MSGARTSNGFGLNPLSFAEIQAWAALTGVEPTPWEVSLLKRLDAVTLANQRNDAPRSNDEPEIEVTADDDLGVKSIFASLKARAKAVHGKR